MSDFIACVEAVGGNRQEIESTIESTWKENRGDKAAVSGSGAIIQGGASIQLDKDVERRIAEKLSTKYFPGGVAACQMPLSDDGLQKRSTYVAVGRRDDLRTIQDYLSRYGWQNIQANEESVCKLVDTYHLIKELAVNNTMLIITTYSTSNDARCPTGFGVSSEDLDICEANIDDLDEAFQLFRSGGPDISVEIRCLNGDCVRCKNEHRFKNRLQDWTTAERTSIQINYMRLEVSEPSGGDYAKVDKAVGSFLRSLARVISSGSDQAFCKKVAMYC